uniref:Protein kinase domain-containing protein n=1 Tax=Physcomitrium patens TaxID=3218 RepID=A0A2K1K2M3_PHYPA|nr:hypothetical protein PHYPA_012502 [Physcomitrium patens]
MVWRFLEGFQKQVFLRFLNQCDSHVQQIDTFIKMQEINRYIWRQCEIYVREMKNLLKKKDILNRNQCISIYKKLHLIMNTFQYLIIHSNNSLECGLIFCELFILMKKIGLLCCYDVVSHILLKQNPKEFEGFSCIIFDVATFDEVEEVTILASLSRLNIIKYFFVINSKNNKSRQILKEHDTDRELYLDVELIQTRLGHMLKEKKSMSFIFIIDIIYQITKDMYYLHDMQIINCDLKLDNILVNIIKDKILNNLTQHATIKLIGFGMSKVNVGRHPKVSKNRYAYGSIQYMAPKALRNKFERTKMCLFETHGFSFLMVYFKFLSKKYPFDGISSIKEILKKIQKDERTKLPSNCDELNKLIKEYWNWNSLHHPNFQIFVKDLSYFKKDSNWAMFN